MMLSSSHFIIPLLQDVPDVDQQLEDYQPQPVHNGFCRESVHRYSGSESTV